MMIKHVKFMVQGLAYCKAPMRALIAGHDSRSVPLMFILHFFVYTVILPSLHIPSTSISPLFRLECSPFLNLFSNSSHPTKPP